MVGCNKRHLPFKNGNLQRKEFTILFPGFPKKKLKMSALKWKGTKPMFSGYSMIPLPYRLLGTESALLRFPPDAALSFNGPYLRRFKFIEKKIIRKVPRLHG